LPDFLSQFPDPNNYDTIEQIKVKCHVLYLGLELPKLSPKSINDVHVICWNHRWEYDKNPAGFVRSIRFLVAQGVDFRLVLLGERFKGSEQWINEILEVAGDCVIFNGYAKSKKEYWHWLRQSDILPVYAYQEFFGISVAEGIHAGLVPLLPYRLTYPELYPDCWFYDNEQQLNEELVREIDLSNTKENNYSVSIQKFSWDNSVLYFDEQITK